MSFLLLLTVPASFYRNGRRGALGETAAVVSVFILTVWKNRRWMKFYKIDPPPTSLNARILTGLAFTIVFVLSVEVPFLLHAPLGILIGLQAPLLFGLLGHPRTPWWFTKPGFWKNPNYALATVVLAMFGATLVIRSWPALRWWSLLVVPGFLLSIELGELIGRAVRRWVLALEEVWELARRMGPAIGGFALGYLVIAFMFAGLFASVWRADSTAFRGLPEHPTLVDFAYYSAMTISTTGYGDVAPQSPLAKILASSEALNRTCVDGRGFRGCVFRRTTAASTDAG
jgi:Ion channel